VHFPAITSSDHPFSATSNKPMTHSALSTLAGSCFAQLDWKPLFEEQGIPLAAMGLVVVFSALFFVRVFIALLPRLMVVLDRYYPEHEEHPQDFTQSAMVDNAIPGEILAVIAAAVAHTIRRPHRIVHTRDLMPADLSWTREGRQIHHTSHHTQHRNSY
jgi:Na+-transporting methylmalonyl-CoA/oxaloacetate decarboxylase gamma subunit